VLDLVADIGGGYVVVEALRVIADHDFALTLALVLPLDELLLDVIVAEWLHKRTEFLLLVVTRRTARVHEDRRRDDCSQHLRLFELALVDVQHYQQVEIYALVVVGSRRELNGAEVNLTIDHLHLTLPSDAHVD
jgi:hypothetical protein